MNNMQKKYIPVLKQLITEDSYRVLPRMVQIAFAARASRRILPIVSSNPKIYRFYEDAIKKVETIPAFPDYSNNVVEKAAKQLIYLNRNHFLYGIVQQFTDIYEERMLYKSVSSLIAAAVDDALDNYISRMGHEKAFDAYDYAFAALIGYAKSEYQYNQFAELASEFKIISEFTSDHNWDDDTSINNSNEFFLQHYKFYPSTENKIDSSLSELSLFLKKRTMEYFGNKPEELYNMPPTEFEHLIANLLKEHEKFSFNKVKHVGKIKNLGADIIATETDAWSRTHEILIECKRYSVKNKICFGIMQRLNGAIYDRDADKGILVTTSYFTKDSVEYIEDKDYRLSGIDYDTLIELIRSYDHKKMASFFTQEIMT
jgi:hypothetical protein